MPIRKRAGKWEYRFEIDGHEWSHITDLEATERNRNSATRLEAEARRLVLDGREHELKRKSEPFDSAADSFITWAKGEYCEHPNTWKRIAVSMTSLKHHFGRRPLGSLTKGAVEDYKSVRRAVHKVKEVTLRHDLHALSLLFQYGAGHDWCRRNVVDEVQIPSDASAVRIRVLTGEEEARYLAAIDMMQFEARSAKARAWDAVNGNARALALQDLRDLSVLMLNQGCRPEELRAMEQSAVDLAAGAFAIRGGKSLAARRTLRLTAASRDVLARRLQDAGKWVFPSRKRPGKHMGQAQRLHDAVLKRAKLAFVPYDLRHTCATRWGTDLGIDIATIAAWLGHANLRTVQKYIHPAKEHLHAQAEKAEKIWLAMQEQKPEKGIIQ